MPDAKGSFVQAHAPRFRSATRLFPRSRPPALLSHETLTNFGVLDSGNLTQGTDIACRLAFCLPEFIPREAPVRGSGWPVSGAHPRNSLRVLLRALAQGTGVLPPNFSDTAPFRLLVAR